MKITDIKVYKLKPRWIFVKIITDSGISGWGECISGTRTETVVNCIYETSNLIIGRNPLEIEDIWQCLYRYFFRGGPVHMTAVSGIEMALWDIKGKYYNMPVYEFLGGKARRNIKVYSWIGGDRPSDVGKAALERKNLGFTAVKMNACDEMHYIDTYKKIEAVLERVDSIRKSVGNDVEIAIDFHGRVHKAMAKVLAHELEIYHPMFIEEPVLPENDDTLKEIASHTSIPIATGERLCTRWSYKHIMQQGVVDIIQPDISLTGGIFEVRKIAAMAEAYDIAVAPHAPYGPIALAATLQVDSCTQNVFIQEQSLGIHYNQGFDLLDFVKNKEIFQYKKGFVDVPSGAGLGIEIDEEMVEKVSLEGLNWTNPRWRNYDGTLSEW
ncbi:MAG: galactonate dehydratase [Clostridium sp.]|jgi:galactonate dehydratase|uniref:galactonate dehydratase n=1 Tax=Clostridium sp. TaxID=1506 RepID=UPI0025B7CC9B|nr:galactonate dehydratase [Clostridium sp.]MCH3965104.1 galactonate dehydratase [Clostridium sp.]MCI1714325.1 galactonate dehydratase [Clostridium sp.]MCI1798587.1 galactonate dehydratase [Clostridium sp.]MCI1812682.1 galactonate dehydratase [Clostridium sp.]MCI1869396.1 galactonate dehydratase [Clostridium sp.]